MSDKQDKKKVTDELTFEEARELAKGDIACFFHHRGKYDLRNVINASSKWLSVLPNQVWRKDDPEAWNHFYFYDPQVAQRWEGQTLKMKGFKAVRVGPSGDYDCDYDFFDIDKNEDQPLVVAGHTVYARPGEMWLEDEERKLGTKREKQSAEWDSNFAEAERLGLGAFQIKNGEKQLVVKPAARLYDS